MNLRARTLCRYVFSAMGGLVLAYVYNVTDGIFVGRGVGADALGAVNLAVPFITLAIAVAAMPAAGGGTIVAISLGKGDRKGADRVFMHAFVLTLFMAAAVMLVGMLLPKQIINICGGNRVSDDMRDLGVKYLFYFSAFFAPQLVATCLSVFVRNDGAPVYSFVGMGVGAVSNIFFDWLFIFPLGMGVVGSALASGVGQVLSLLVLLSYFFFRKKKGSLKFRKFRMEGKAFRDVCRRGLPQAASQLITPVTTLCFNIVLAKYSGDVGVSTFSVLYYVFSLVNAILCGTMQGLQPLWGGCYGRDDTKEMRSYFRYGMAINVVLGVAIFVLMYFFSEPVLKLFTNDADVAEMGASALPLFAASFVPMSANLIFTGYLYSTKRTARANVIALCRGLVLNAVSIFCMPLMVSIDYIWLAPLAAETLTLVIALVLAGVKRRGTERPEPEGPITF